MIRVLIAEDSASAREHLVALLGPPVFQVVGAVEDGARAVEEAERLMPDVILMDVHMPRMDGIEATRRIMASSAPRPIVLTSAGFNREDAAMGFDAISAGALTLVGKPAGEGHPDHARSVREVRDTLRLMSEVKVVRRWSRPARPPEALPRTATRARLVAIGASTGGPAVLAEILGALGPGLGAPLLVVQHIAPGFIEGLAEWLAGQTRVPVRVAAAGEAAEPGTGYIAPDALQMGIGPDGRIRLCRDGDADGFCPSASRLFESVADSFGSSAIGVLLTGMGRDGVAGLKRLREAGGTTVAQDEATSVVFGMPGEAVRAGAAEHVLPPAHIARLIRSLAGEGR